MIGTGTDMIGLAAVITAFFGGLASLVAAIQSTRGNRQSTNIAAAVTTPPDAPPLGQVVADAAATLDHVHDVVCDVKDATGTVPVVRPEGASPPG